MWFGHRRGLVIKNMPDIKVGYVDDHDATVKEQKVELGSNVGTLRKNSPPQSNKRYVKKVEG